MSGLKKDFTPLRLYIFGIFLFAVLFGYFCVWTHDDYLTNFSGLSELLRESLYFGNGRYIGNLIVNIFLPHKLPDALMRGFCLTLNIVLTAKLASAYHWKGIAVSAALFIGYGNLILREAFIWGHGFYNFFPPVTLLLMSVRILQCYYVDNGIKMKKTAIVLLAFFGFSQQLFSENTTCIALLISAVIFGFVFYNKKTKLPAAVYLAASAAGAFIMFALPEIMQVSYKMKDYRGRSIGADSLAEFVKQFTQNMNVSLMTLASLFFAWAFLSYVLIKNLMRDRAISKSGKMKKRVFMFVFACYPAVSLFYFFVNEKKWKERIPLTSIKIPDIGAKLSYVVFALFIIYAICVFVALLSYVHEKNRRLLYIVLLGLAVLSVGELLIITVMGTRCLFLPACILSVFILKLISDDGSFEKCFSVVSCAVGSAAMAAVLFVMGSIWNVNNARFAYANQQLAEGKKIIEIIRLPHERWLHVPNESAGYGFYFNYGETKPEEDYTYITYEDYLARQNLQK